MIVLTVMLCVGCGSRHNARSPYGFWDTGSPRLDSLLNRADTLDRVIDYDESAALRVWQSVADASDTLSSDPSVRAVAYLAKASVEEFLSDNPEYVTLWCDSMAAQTTRNLDQDCYLALRVRFEAARRDQDLKRRTECLYDLLPRFCAISDSMRVVDILFALTDSFGDVWDPVTQTECFSRIIRWTPEFLAPLRDIMRFNILAVERGNTPADKYLHNLDSLTRCHDILTASPPLALMVYSDRFRLRGNVADLDSAELYAGRLTMYHDALKVYWSQRLTHALRSHDGATATRYATEIENHIADASPMEIETLPALRDYYRSVGDTPNFTRVDSIYRMMRIQADALEKSSALASMKADARKNEIVEEAPDGNSGKWILIAVAMLVLAGTLIALLIQRHHKNDNATESVRYELENARRQLSVSELKNINAAAPGADWESFEAVFTKMHPLFADRLRSDFPALTRNDIRLCALIMMDLDNKQIANILHIQPESVKKRMQRLRTRLSLPPAAPLRSFLARF